MVEVKGVNGHGPGPNTVESGAGLATATIITTLSAKTFSFLPQCAIPTSDSCGNYFHQRAMLHLSPNLNRTCRRG